MKVTFLNSNDKMGERFSGLDWFSELENQGWQSNLLVGHQPTKADSRISQTTKLNTPSVISTIRALEIYNGRQNAYSPFYPILKNHQFIKNADVLHFQVMHDLGWFRHEDIFRLSKIKPSIWTWHDAWNVTGHCIQPLDCVQFEKNCGQCPHLEWDLPIAKDTAKKEKERKSKLIQKNELPTIHVTTNWMKNLVYTSKGFENTMVEVIPFGIDLTVFKQREKKNLQQAMGISNESFVIGFRSSTWNVKNLDLILNALPKIHSEDYEIVIVTVDQIGNLDKAFKVLGNKRIIELGWIGTENLVKFYNCLDVFLAVSVGESFGFMALEAYACGVPVICLEGTAIAELVEKVEVSHVIRNSNEELASTITKIMKLNSAERKVLKQRITTYVNENHSLIQFIKKMTLLYELKIETWDQNVK
jgi:glycosyltransferase involved in cell wall biosynthesis